MRSKAYFGKRFSDLIYASIFFLLSSPLFILVPLIIYFTYGRPIIYKGARVGLSEKVFYQYKFRTMYQNISDNSFTSYNDNRITKVGKYLRLLKIDELPQLYNVFKGDMSIVGPRPEVEKLVKENYTQDQKRVFTIMPGITSPLVVKYFPDYNYHIPDNLSNQEHYNNVLLKERLKEDLIYIDEMSLFFDLKIIIKTLICILIKSWFFFKRRK